MSAIFDLSLPYISYRYKKYKEKSTGVEVSFPEKDYIKEPYDNKSLLNDYLEIVISFGFMTMFISALPGAAAIVFLTLWVEIKGDIWRLTHICRRPWPVGAEVIK